MKMRKGMVLTVECQPRSGAWWTRAGWKEEDDEIRGRMVINSLAGLVPK